MREDGGCTDLGYVRAVAKADGQVLALYYYCDTAEGERTSPQRRSRQRRLSRLGCETMQYYTCNFRDPLSDSAISVSCDQAGSDAEATAE